jgi:hypothetical protein
LQVGDGRAATDVEFVFPRALVAGAVALNPGDASEAMLHLYALSEASPPGAGAAQLAEFEQQSLLGVDGDAATVAVPGSRAVGALLTRVARRRGKVHDARVGDGGCLAGGTRQLARREVDDATRARN